MTVFLGKKKYAFVLGFFLVSFEVRGVGTIGVEYLTGDIITISAAPFFKASAESEDIALPAASTTPDKQGVLSARHPISVF